MNRALVDRQSGWNEPAAGESGISTVACTAWLEEDWHEETHSCGAPAPSGGWGRTRRPLSCGAVAQTFKWTAQRTIPDGSTHALASFLIEMFERGC